LAARGRPATRRVRGRPRYAERRFNFPDHPAGLSRESLAAHVDLYRGYLKQLNALLEALQPGSGKAGDNAAAERRQAIADRHAFEANGVRLHELYFAQLGSTGGSPDPKGALAAEIKLAFGSIEEWRADLATVAETRGIGWAVTAWDPDPGCLTNLWLDLHERGVPANQRVVFALDLWEHAYLADYGTSGRAKYVDAVLDAVNWPVVEERLNADA
jgi:superoxide dismutase, Fe-Mn family